MNNLYNPQIPIDILQEFIISYDISKVWTALEYLKNNAHKESDNKVLSQWAQILTHINLNNSADLQLLYAEVFHDLYNWKKKKGFPDWRSWKAPIVVEIKWRQLEIYIKTNEIDFSNIDEITLQGLYDLDTKRLLNPELFFEKISHAANDKVQITALKLIRQGLSNYTILPHQAYTYLTILCQTQNLLILKETLEFLSKAWAQCEEYPKAIVELALKVDSLAVKKSALRLMDSRNAFDKLEIILKDERQNPLLRCEAMKVLGKSRKKGLIKDILSISAADSLLYGEACFASLEMLHHCGIFVKEENLDDLISIFIKNNKCSEQRFEMLTFTCREQLIGKLSLMGDDFDLWNRLCLVVPLIQTTSKINMVIDILKRTNDISTKKALIKVLGKIGGQDTENAVLGYLEEYPQECLYSLKFIGTKKTADILWYALGVESKKHISLYLLPYRKEALTILWHLSDEGKRNILKATLNPSEIPSGILSDIIPTMSKADLRLLLFKKDDLDLEEILSTLCKYGSTETIAEISDLLLRHVSESAANGYVEYSEDNYHNGQPIVSYNIRKSIIKFGEKLFTMGKLRPVYLLNSKTSREAGEILLSEMIFEIIETHSLLSDELRMLLEVIESLSYYNISLRLRKLIRSKEPQVRKMVIRCLVKQHAIGYSFDLLRLIEEDDIETIRQAVIAMGEFNATWASSYVVRCLEHPNMNIKKTSAKALIKIGDYKAVNSILFWSGYHDNDQFRQILTDALKAVAGSGYLSLVLRELENSTDERKTGLLLKIFDGSINRELVKNLLRNKSKSAQMILDAVVNSQIRLSDGNIIDLINSEDNIYKSYFEKVLSNKEQTSNTVRQVYKIGDKNEIRNFLKNSSMSGPELRFILINYLEEWLDFINDTDEICREFLENFLDTAQKAFTDSHYEILADKISVLLKILESDVLTLNTSEEFFKVLHKTIGMLPMPMAIKIAEDIRKSTILKSKEYGWTYKLIKQCNCILLDSDIYNTISKLDNVPSKAALLKDAYKSEYLGPRNNRNIIDDIINELALNVPSWTDRKFEEINNEIEFKKISFSNETIYNNDYKDHLLNLLDDPDPVVRKKAAEAILDRDETSSGHKQVFSAYLEGKVKLDKKYNPILQKTFSSFSESWYIEQINCQTNDWTVRLLKLVSGIYTYKLTDYISWLQKLCQHADESISNESYKLLESIDPCLLIRDISELPEIKSFKPLFLDENDIDDLYKTYNELHEPISKTSRELNKEANQLPSLITDARSNDSKRVIAALKGLAKYKEKDAVMAVTELIEHPDSKVRSAAYRCLRKIADKKHYLNITCKLLQDTKIDVVKSAIQTLAFSKYEAAIPAIVDFLASNNPKLCKYAAEGLKLMGACTIPYLKKAENKSRPDHQHRYREIIDSILAK